MFKKLILAILVATTLSVFASSTAMADKTGYPCGTQLADWSTGDRLWFNLYSQPDCAGSYIGYGTMVEGSTHNQPRILAAWNNIVLAMANALSVIAYQSGTNTEVWGVGVRAY